MLRSMLQDSPGSGGRALSSREYILHSLPGAATVPRVASVGSLCEDEMFEGYHGRDAGPEIVDAVFDGSDGQPASPDSLHLVFDAVENDDATVNSGVRYGGNNPQWSYNPVGLTSNSTAATWLTADRGNALLTAGDPQCNSAMLRHQIQQCTAARNMGGQSPRVWSSQAVNPQTWGNQSPRVWSSQAGNPQTWGNQSPQAWSNQGVALQWSSQGAAPQARSSQSPQAWSSQGGAGWPQVRQSVGVPIPISSRARLSSTAVQQASPEFIPPHEMVTPEDAVLSYNLSGHKGLHGVRMREHILELNGFRDGKTEHVQMPSYPGTFN